MLLRRWVCCMPCSLPEGRRKCLLRQERVDDGGGGLLHTDVLCTVYIISVSACIYQAIFLTAPATPPKIRK